MPESLRAEPRPDQECRGDRGPAAGCTAGLCVGRPPRRLQTPGGVRRACPGGPGGAILDGCRSAVEEPASRWRTSNRRRRACRTSTSCRLDRARKSRSCSIGRSRPSTPLISRGCRTSCSRLGPAASRRCRSRHDPGGVDHANGLGGFADGSLPELVELAREQWSRRSDRAELARRCRCTSPANTGLKSWLSNGRR